jgi:ferredoxin
MNLKERAIIFTIICSGIEYHVHTYENEYYSLMNLISDYAGIAGFGLCSGMGSCGTCFVEICEKINDSKKNVLSCGIKIDDELCNVEITILESVY